MKRQIEIDELKKIQLDILDYVTSFCDENNIHYFLDGGTLLGAIRHNGYIPWDDDIDIGMLRDDYEKMKVLFNEKNYDSKYKFLCYETDNSFYLPMGKIIDCNTTLFEPDENGNKLGVNIDVFVYDNAPDNENLVNKQFKLRDRYRVLNDLQHLNHKPRGNFLRRFVVCFCSFITKCLPDQFFLRKMIKNSQKYNGIETKKVGNFSGFMRAYCDRNVLNGFVDVDFEGKKYKAPVDYDKWLRSFYGNYMKLPPLEKRVSHHSFVAYFNE